MQLKDIFINPERVQIRINGTLFSLNNFEKKSENTFLILNDFIVATENIYVIELIYENMLFLDADFYLNNVLRI